ncbi:MULTISPECIES: Lrp/AsnC family transcriptional regulator [unclassified Hyphomicrobium]|uniref:Lrp/AsnC family transcriptional regulator n=1 Tax=unclassified Hyphomicrobium TaxID=2619925 RepID=UPI000213D413|nr:MULTISPECIES: AsnC family transcriptional regulator [unclassified Hyphomicrobium]CCB68067.1 putative AsnC-family protein transcriptional regulator [Hyphomicrobium sp. MC1]
MKRNMTTPDYLRLVASLDDIDRRIVSLLQADGRMPFSHIAREIGVTEKTARSRVLDLIEQRVMQITAVTNPALLGYGASALLGLTTHPDQPATKIAQELQKIPSIDYVVVATSRYSIFAEVLCKDRSALQSTIENEVGKIPGIRSIEAMPYLSFHYQLAHFAAVKNKVVAEAGVRPRAIDAIDERIIRSLSEDGRKPFLQIADELDISEGQVRLRFKQLTDTGTVNVIALINPMSLEFRSMAWVAINVAAGHRATDVADALTRLANTTYVVICAGRFDILSEFICQTDRELLDVIERDVRPLTGIANLEISIYSELYYKRLTPIRDEAG